MKYSAQAEKQDKRLLLTGEYQHTVDGKGRILVPNKLRSQIDAGEYGNSLYLLLGPNGILCLYPEKYFEEIAYAAAQDIAPDEAVAFERIYFSLADKVELDGQGRLLLKKEVRERATLGDQVTFIGVMDHMELWNSEDWEGYLSDHMAQYHKQTQRARQVSLEDQADKMDY